MPECEICGREVSEVFEINVEGAQMLVCEADARGKEVVRRYGSEEERRQPKAQEMYEKPGEEEIIDNYGEEIRKAREKLGLPLKVLGEMIAEKESTLLRIEEQKTLPSEKTRLKLEKELGIKLTDRVSGKKTFVSSKKNEPVTLWDIAKEENEKKEQGE